MKKFIFIVFLFLTACTDSNGTIELLKDQGYENVVITGYNWFGCSDDDFFHTGFIVVKDNREIEGVACSGFFKATTIRFY